MRQTPFLLLALLCVTFAYAEQWTIQTVALRDFEMAGEWIEDLRAQGLNAYHEFAMDNGKQYTRVRFGCFSEREAAESAAAAARQQLAVVQEAAVVPLSDDAPVDPCVVHEVGFNLPDAWGVLAVEEAGILFWVEVGGRRGYLAFDGGGWQVLQTLTEAEALKGTSWLAAAGEPGRPLLTASTGDAVPASFREWRRGGYLKAVTEAGEEFLIGRGEVLWSSDRAAVIATDFAVVAVTLVANGK